MIFEWRFYKQQSYLEDSKSIEIDMFGIIVFFRDEFNKKWWCLMDKGSQLNGGYINVGEAYKTADLKNNENGMTRKQEYMNIMISTPNNTITIKVKKKFQILLIFEITILIKNINALQLESQVNASLIYIVLLR